MRLAFAETINDPPPGHVHEPAFERTRFRFVTERLHFASDADDGFLHNLLRLRVGQAEFNRRAIDELPVGVEKFLPRGVVVEIAQAFEQALARRHQLAVRAGGKMRFGHSSYIHRGTLPDSYMNQPRCYKKK